jgi:hypothetical protein
VITLMSKGPPYVLQARVGMQRGYKHACSSVCKAGYVLTSDDANLQWEAFRLWQLQGRQTQGGYVQR